MKKLDRCCFVSRLKPPIKPSTRILQQRNRTQEEPITNLASVRRFLIKRSKSMPDIRCNYKPTDFGTPSNAKIKLKLTSTLNSSNKGAISSNVSMQKEVTNDIQDKKPKPSKPAPYDYKARFALITEKHNALVKTHKEMKQLYCTYNEEIEYNRNLKISFEKLSEEHLKLNNEIEKLKNENLILKQDNTELKNEVEELTKDVCEFINFHEKNRRLMHNEIQDLKGNIRVFCRIRPSLQNENHRLLCNINCLEEDTLKIQKLQESRKLEFHFDKVFDTTSTQAEVFEEVSHLVQSALDGYHVCIFAYGQTGSGKTYTMQGGADEHLQGVIPRTANLIFEFKSILEKLGWVYTIEASFLEIYNETIKDLLNRNNQQNLEIRLNQELETTVPNLTIKNINTFQELYSLMTLANSNRSTAATNFNEHSSRSHAVTRIKIKGINESMNNCCLGSLNLVDLAGSESPKHSDRMMETKNIIKSLSTLGAVLSALHSKVAHILYRNSKLTHLLQNCLGGNSKTLIIVNIAPFDECYRETVNSLSFAAKVKQANLGCKGNKRQN